MEKVYLNVNLDNTPYMFQIKSSDINKLKDNLMKDFENSIWTEFEIKDAKVKICVFNTSNSYVDYGDFFLVLNVFEYSRVESTNYDDNIYDCIEDD